jgi:hypothetical protein
VADKKEWPEWQAQADMVERKLAPSGVMKGGRRNPLGARILLLDDGSLSIHGTNAPATKVDGPSCTFPTRASCGGALCATIVAPKSAYDPETGRPWTDKKWNTAGSSRLRVPHLLLFQH